MGKRGNGEGAIYSREQRKTRADGTVYIKTIWCAAVSLDFGKRKVIYGSTREEVAAELVRCLGARQSGLPIPGTRLKTTQYLERWLEDTVRPSRRPLTYVRYAGVVRNHLVPAIGKLPLARVGPEHVQRLQARLQADGLSVASIQGVRNTLGAALTQAERWGLIARNPVRLVEPPPMPEREPRVLDTAETAAFLEAARGDEMEHLFTLMLATGLRPGEVRGLAWADVHLGGPTPTIEVRQQSIEVKDGPASRRRELSPPKSRHGRRSIPLVALGVEALEAQRRRRAEQPVRGLQNLVFPSPDGGPLLSRRVRNHFLRIAELAGIQGATPHTLRHTTGTYLLAAGVPDRVVQEILGHGSAAMTRHYQHVTSSMLAEAGVRLGALLHPLLHPEIEGIGN
jgi:integrase